MSQEADNIAVKNDNEDIYSLADRLRQERAVLSRKYWDYYLTLERRFLEFRDYVEFDERNNEAFSNGFAMLMQSIGAELDSVFKEFCGFNVNARKNINDYAVKILSDDIFDIRNRVVKVPIADIKLQPFKEWNTESPGQSLDWWMAFTSIKHNRYGNRDKANFKNTLSILGALFLLENLWLKRITDQLGGYKNKMIQLAAPDIFDNQSKLFERDWPKKCKSLGNGHIFCFTPSNE